MTAPDPVPLFRQAIPAWLRTQLHDTQHVTAAITKAVDNGWTVEQLATHCTRDLAGYRNAGEIVTHRVIECADTPPPRRDKPHPRPLCGRCENGLIYHEPADPLDDVTATKCECRGRD